ncbi:hypothetical protein BK749_15900 [Bacillus thuringiensis serovar vazensis]|uniref:HD-GYP domain-containing protein n=1 Tax=Bacillus thuringiensis serovar vazensis TaxID=180867 RepID=A0A243CXM4_BACTU|nr:hypothetical protein BK749_15900 [Bacillus thuringiensis serovar vazensis]
MLLLTIMALKDARTEINYELVAVYVTILVEKMKLYLKCTLDKFYNYFLLHDIGKIGMLNFILNKPPFLAIKIYDFIK